jgi:hypothetical protein
MYDPDIEKLLERNLTGSPAGSLFRERVLRDSGAALGGRRGLRSAACIAAAVLIAATSFLWGRASVSRSTAAPAVANSADTVSVPVELVAWLEAARFFKQLDMPERVTLAYEHAGKLVPHETLQAGEGNHTALAEMTRKTHAILAQSFGG